MHEELRLTIANDLGELGRVNELAHSFLESHGFTDRVVYTTELALEEVLSNVIRHGYGDGGKHELSVCLRVVAGAVELDIVDDGREFDPLSAPPPDLHAPLQDRPVGGLGVHLLRKLVSEMRYERVDGHNHLWLRI